MFCAKETRKINVLHQIFDEKSMLFQTAISYSQNLHSQTNVIFIDCKMFVDYEYNNRKLLNMKYRRKRGMYYSSYVLFFFVSRSMSWALSWSPSLSLSRSSCSHPCPDRCPDRRPCPCPDRAVATLVPVPVSIAVPIDNFALSLSLSRSSVAAPLEIMILASQISILTGAICAQLSFFPPFHSYLIYGQRFVIFGFRLLAPHLAITFR